MNAHRFTAPYNDEAIVAWIDGEMCHADAQKFEEQLRRDERLSGRTAELMKSNADYPGAFAAMLDDAPLEKMQARLAELPDPKPATPVGVSRRALIAASVSFLVVGSGVGYGLRPAFAPSDENAHIRDLEAQYMSLYSVETLLDMDSAPHVLQRGLERAAQDIGLQLQASKLILHGAELKMVRMLRYETTSIAQIAWINADYGPMALCISPTEQTTTAAQQEQRHDMNLVWWQKAGYQFVLIGRNPLPQLRGSAEQLQSLISG
ncbi:anti-sigma factor family protein [Enterobacter ludwigii]